MRTFTDGWLRRSRFPDKERSAVQKHRASFLIDVSQWLTSTTRTTPSLTYRSMVLA